MKATTLTDRPQYRSNSLLEFLLGDGTHPGWLDTQLHHSSRREMNHGMPFADGHVPMTFK